MSYTILYRSMFAKVGDNQFIPMIELGANNVYGTNGRRCRHWQNWTAKGYDGKIILTMEEILNGVRKCVEKTMDEYVNRRANEYDPIDNPYWTFDDVYKNYGYLSAVSVAGKGTHKTTARMVENFIKRGFEQCVDMRNIGYIGNFPLHICFYDEYYVRERYYDSLEHFLSGLKDHNGTNHWVTYGTSADALWNMHRIKRR